MTQQNAWHLLQIASFAGESFAGEPAPASHQSTCRSRLAGESLAGDFPKYDLRFHLDTRQRIRLASPIGARLVGVMYILDEPSIALHQRLLRTLNHLRDLGNTVVVIEHNLYVIKTAGWIIDPGPEGGTGGGVVVVTGTPQDVARHRDSWTGRFLKHALKAASPKQQHAAG